jgi:hypothetical protein
VAFQTSDKDIFPKHLRVFPKKRKMVEERLRLIMNALPPDAPRKITKVDLFTTTLKG